MKTNNKKIFGYILLLIVLIAFAIIAFVFIYKTHSERNIYEDKNQEVVNELKKYLSNVQSEGILENIIDNSRNEFDFNKLVKDIEFYGKIL